MMVHEIGPFIRKNLFQRIRISDVRFIEICFRVDVLPLAARKVIDDGDFMPVRDIGVDDMRCNEPRSAGYKYFHGV